PVAERTRYLPDCWYFLYLYDPRTTTPLVNAKPTMAMWNDLVAKMQAGSIATTLNPFVQLYGALPTEGAIRAGFYPGRLQRQYGINFFAGREEENMTIPWGINSIWYGSGAKYSWKGICNCLNTTAYGRTGPEIFRWVGPDNNELLFKWYYPDSTNMSWGGYAEARVIANKTSSPNSTPPAGSAQYEIHQRSISHFDANLPGLPIGAFGEGWDDVSWQSTSTETIVHDWNTGHPSDPAYLSNGLDYFQALEAFRSSLPAQRGGFGIDWDLWPTSMS